MEKDVNLTPSRIDQLEKGTVFDPGIPGLCVIVVGPSKKSGASTAHCANKNHYRTESPIPLPPRASGRAC